MIEPRSHAYRRALNISLIIIISCQANRLCRLTFFLRDIYVAMEITGQMPDQKKKLQKKTIIST